MYKANINTKNQENNKYKTKQLDVKEILLVI